MTPWPAPSTTRSSPPLRREGLSRRPSRLPGFFPPQERAARTVDKAHGRLEIRELRLFAPSVADYIRTELNFPYVRQAFCLTRTVTRLSSSPTTVETVYGIISLPHISASELLSFVRSHWKIESNHFIRDTTFGEDRSTLHTGSGPQAMAALRNFTIGLVTLIRRKRPSLPFDIPGVLRHFSRSGDQVFRVLGL